MNHLLTGRIKNQAGRDISTSLLVKAFQIELGKQTEIGQSLTKSRNTTQGLKTYEIKWERLEIGRSKINIQLSVYLPDGSFLGQTEILTLTSPRLNQDITISEAATYKTYLDFTNTEYGQLRSTLEQQLQSQKITIAALNEKDIFLLAKELVEINPVFKLKKIKQLVQTEQLSASSGLSGAFLYGLAFLQPETEIDLQAFLDLEEETIKDQLQLVESRKVIPVVDKAELLVQLNNLRLTAGSFIEKELVLQLFNKVNNQPLEYYQIDVKQLPGRNNLGIVWTNDNGIAIFKYSSKAVEKTEFEIIIKDYKNIVVFENTLRADKEIIPINIEISFEQDSSPTIAKLSDLIQLPLTVPIKNFLTRNRITTIEELVNFGGFSKLEDQELTDQSSKLKKRLESHAEFYLTLSSYEPNTIEQLINAGYTGIERIANATRIQFVRKVGPAIGNYQAASILKQAKTSRAVLKNVLLKNPLSNLSNNGARALGNNLPLDKCQGPTAVSPSSYLADLVKYIQDHIQKGEDQSQAPIMLQLSDLENNLYQPFGDLPMIEEAIEMKVNQVRIAIEVLRAYLSDKQLPPVLSPDAIIYQNRYKIYLENIYTAYLLSLGTSVSEIQQAIRLKVGESAEARQIRQNELLNRLQLPFGTNLSLLLLEEDQLSEAKLEYLFGFSSTLSHPLSEGVLLTDNDVLLTNNIPFQYWNFEGIQWNRNTDENGYVYFTVREENGIFKVKIYKSKDRLSANLLAEGETINQDGIIRLQASPNFNYLKGTIKLNFNAAVNNLKISIIPLTQCWQFQYLYKNRWEVEDSFTNNLVIEPDLLNKAYFALPLDLNPAYKLWKERVQFVENRLIHWRQFMLAESPSIRFDGLIAAMNINLAQPYETVQLSVPSLSKKAYDYLKRLATIFNAPQGALLHQEWENLFSIFLQIEKDQNKATWIAEEVNRNISLAPDYFKIPATYIPEPTLSDWRINKKNVRTWRNTLRNRQAEWIKIQENYQSLLEDQEASYLPILRDVLLEISDAQGDTLFDKSNQVTKFLLIQMQMDSCMITTRTAQAIDTLQKLIWLIQIGQLKGIHPNWKIISDYFEEEWKWLGSYATWKSAMMVYLYPENVLHPGLRRANTNQLKQIISRLRNTPRLTPQTACEVATDYQDFLTDLRQLKVEASCEARVALTEAECGKTNNITSTYLFFIFARSETSGKTYWSTYQSGIGTGQNHSFWRSITGLDIVEKIIGASVYQLNISQRFIYLFIKDKIPQTGRERLGFIRYDLEKRDFDPIGLQELDLPSETTSFKAVINQKNTHLQAPDMIIQVQRDGHNQAYYNRLDQFGFTWEKPFDSLNAVHEKLFAGNAPLDWQVHGLVSWSILQKTNLTTEDRFGQPQAFLLFSSGNTGITCSLLSTVTTTGALHRINPSLSGATAYFMGKGNWKGAIHWSDTANLVYALIEKNGKLEYKVFWGTNYQEFFAIPEPIPGTISTFYKTNDDLNAFGALVSIAPHCSSLSNYNFTQKLCYNLAGGDPGVYLGYFTRDLSNYFEQVSDPLLTTTNLRGGRNTSFNFPGEGIIPGRVKVSGDLLLGDDGFDLGNDGPFPGGGGLSPGAPPSKPNNIPIRHIRKTRLVPFLNIDLSVLSNISTEALQLRKTLMASVFIKNKKGLFSNISYLEEAYLFIPILIASHLKRNGFYLEALNWLRLVYDYTQPVSERKIFYGLIAEETVENQYDRSLNWLLDPLNPHKIAKSRTNAYTNYIIQTIVQFHIEYGDTEFAKDNQESISRALTIYQSAKELLTSFSIINNQNTSSSTSISLNETLKEENQNAISLSKIAGISSFVQNHLSINTAIEYDFDYSYTKLTGLKKRELETMNLDWVGAASKSASTNSSLRISRLAAETDHFETLKVIAKDNPTYLLDQNQVIPISFIPNVNGGFCIPNNPVLKSLVQHLDNQIEKIVRCRNIFGLIKPLNPYITSTNVGSGTPDFSLSDVSNSSNNSSFQPTIYRFRFLVERAKQIAGLAQQMEAALLSALKERDSEAYNLLKARQDISLSFSGVRLNRLKIKEAQDGIIQSELQKERTDIQISNIEEKIEESNSFGFGKILGVATSLASVVAGGVTGQPGLVIGGVSGLYNTVDNESELDDLGQSLRLAQKDGQVSSQGILLAQDRQQIVNQEFNIAVLNSTHALETLDFLSNKFTNLDLFDWMSNVLEGVYNTILQQSTAVSRIAAQQLAFERQQTIPNFIQSDYWEASLSNEDSAFNVDNNEPDRKGLTGSARLLRDLYQLEQYALDTEQRKLQLTKTISLASTRPGEFQLFRERGKLEFTTNLTQFNRDFPGHYLRLIKRVRVSIIGLIPPVDGIKATLNNNGISRTIIQNNVSFKETIIQRIPETIALTTPINTTGEFDFDLSRQNEHLRPFEGTGIATSWFFEMRKDANISLDYNTIADILITIDYSALHSEDYKQLVLQQLDNTFSADRAFSFRNEFPDQWYDLNNFEPKEQGGAHYFPVKFTVIREDFPANLETLKIKHLTVFLSSEAAPQPITIELAWEQIKGDRPTTNDNLFSSRRGNYWDVILNQGNPIGEWTLAVPQNEVVLQLFKNEVYKDILFVVTYEGILA